MRIVLLASAFLLATVSLADAQPGILTREGLIQYTPDWKGERFADGRPKVIAAESSVTFAFVVVAAAAVTESPWLLVVGLAGHGLKDLWQHRTHFVANTRWWPPFCMVVDWVVAAVIAVEIAAGMNFS